MGLNCLKLASPLQQGVVALYLVAQSVTGELLLLQLELPPLQLELLPLKLELPPLQPELLQNLAHLLAGQLSDLDNRFKSLPKHPADTSF